MILHRYKQLQKDFTDLCLFSSNLIENSIQNTLKYSVLFDKTSKTNDITNYLKQIYLNN